MPSDGCRTLAEYVSALVQELGEADPAARARLRAAVGKRRARIALDDESVEVEFRGPALAVEPAADRPVDGEGVTDRQTVLDLLDGYVTVADAIVDGRLEVRGETEDVHRMFVAIEILLDASARAPGLQELARHFRDDPCRPRRASPLGPSVAEPFPPSAPGGEHGLLARLDLLADEAPPLLDARQRRWDHRAGFEPGEMP